MTQYVGGTWGSLSTAVKMGPPAPAAPTALSEEERHSCRASIKRQIASRQILETKRATIEEMLRSYDAEVDSATLAHQQLCEPLQLELSDLEETGATSIGNREAIPRNNELRRVEIAQAREVQNVKLSDIVDRVDRLKAPLAKQLRDLRSEIAAGAALENKLQSMPLANPAWLLQHHGLKELVASLFKMAESRRVKAAEWAQQRDNSLDRKDEEAAAMLDQRRQRAEAVADATGEALAAASAKERELLQRILEE